MATIEYSVAGQQIVVTKDEKLVENTIGVYTVGFTFDAASWGDFTQKTAVFVHEDFPDTLPYEVPIDDGEAPIPAAVLKYGNIMIGVYGSTQTQQYPTIWAPAKRVWPGAGPGVEPPEDPVFGMVVRTAPQELTEEQQEIARTNIGAAPEVIPDSTPGDIAIIGSNQNIVDGGFKATEAFPVGSASGSIVTIEDGANGVPIKSMTVQIEPIQAGSGGPSPSNVRAISGWTAMKIPRTPANLLCKDAITEGFYIDNTNGALVTYASWFASDWIKVTAGKQYRAKVAGGGTYDNVTNGNCYYAFYDSNREYLSGGTTAQMNAPTNAVWLRMSTPKTMLATLIVIELSYTNEYVIAADYTEGNTYEITFPTEAGTVYGGTLTVNEDGSGTLTEAYKLKEAPTTGWGKAGSRFYYNEPTMKNINGGNVGWCSHYKAVMGTASGNYEISFGDKYFSNAARIVIVDNTYSTAADFMAFLVEQKNANTPVTFVYPLATPLVYQLTADQVNTLLFSTLKGLNNVWVDTGDIAVEYHADPTIYVSKKTKAIKQSIAYLQDDFTAIQPYVINDLVYVGDTLYIVTSAIAQGATMTPNTNCSETTLNAVIKSLR